MAREKITFSGKNGQKLAGLLELPDGDPVACAMFAHCFTCSKNIAAASRISRALTRQGIAVLRFDFTGIGNSDGDFANTNFSSNVEDLLAAGEFMAETIQSPSMLIGHSLGGAAVLVAAHQMDSVKAIVTIGAPATAQHVEHLFSETRAEIENNSEAIVSLGGRDFTIKKQFLDDLQSYASTEHISRLNRALLIFHSPVDSTVPVDEAARIYQAARHPKSFVSLDKADHLLSRQQDSAYVASVIAAWASRFLNLEQSRDDAPTVDAGDVVVSESNKRFGRRVNTDSHVFIADEPTRVGGNDQGPDPYELLLAALGACTSMTIRMYASRKKLDLDDIKITLRHSREHSSDCEDCDEQTPLLDVIERDVEFSGNIDADTRARLMEIADRCPVHRTLENNIVVRSNLVSEAD